MEIKRFEDITEYYLNGKRHREDGPAVEYSNGRKEYYLNDKIHRENEPAIEYTNGDKIYYLNGLRHRENGPAVECANGGKEYYLNGKRHREDGPAVIRGKHAEIWHHGVKISETDEYYIPMKSCNNFLNILIKEMEIKQFEDRIEYYLLHRENGPAVEW